MGGYLLFAGISVALLFSDAAAAAEDCSGKAPVTVTGAVSNIGTVQEEPGETPQTSFVLVFTKPWCGQATLITSLPRNAYCGDGSRVTVSGDYSPPTTGFNFAMFRAREVVSCVYEPDHR
jgi:hypothetical protein